MFSKTFLLLKHLYYFSSNARRNLKGISRNVIIFHLLARKEKVKNSISLLLQNQNYSINVPSNSIILLALRYSLHPSPYVLSQLSKISIFLVERSFSLVHAWKEDCRTRRCAIFHHRFPTKEKEEVYMYIYIYVYTNEIFILAGADAHREPRMGGTVRATDVQRWRGHVSYDLAQKATRWKLLEACSRNYQRFFRHAEENRPHFRPLCRHGDSFLGPEEIVSVSTRNTLFFFFYRN